ncbi:MAG: TVP38/TMEM64 family protein [Alphaproteobacteria bacterium]|nr:TVP38/TMEM64 family protein [Alphaproteobacteria bacterium]
MTESDPPPARKIGWLRFAPIAVIVLVLGGVLASGVHRRLSLESLRESSAALDALVAQNLPLALAAYIGIYAVAVMISMPGALFLTLTGGFLFGIWMGGAATVIAATIGATGVFLAARTAFGDALRARAGGWLKRLEEGFRDNAFNYLLALRLFPGAPFFIVNLAPAFLNVKLRDFVLATFIGIIPGTLVYSAVGNGLRAAFNAGVDVDPVDAARDLLFSPEIIIPIAGLLLLALLPVAAKAFRRKPQGAA